MCIQVVTIDVSWLHTYNDCLSLSLTEMSFGLEPDHRRDVVTALLQVRQKYAADEAGQPEKEH